MKLAKLFALLRTATVSLALVIASATPSVTQMSDRRPYAVFVNGWMDCCSWGMKEVQAELIALGAEIRYVPWDSFRDRAPQRTATVRDPIFEQQAADFINNHLAGDRPLILIGHSLGGDSLLSLASQINRKILFLGVIDPVAQSGLREPIQERQVPAHVDYFFNRWQRNRPFPVNIAVDGRIKSCRARTCDQQEQNLARNIHGSPITVNCSYWEVYCPGYKPGSSNGRKQQPLYHEDMPYDAYIQQQIIDRLQELLREN